MRIMTMAWRNVWRNQRRSIVTISAMTLGLWVMILYSGLIEGMIVDMSASITDMELGEIQIVAAEYRDDPALQVTITDPDTILTRLDEEGLAASARLLGGGLAAVDQASAGVSLIGLDVERDQAVSALWERVAQGSWLDPSNDRSVVLGSKLARTLQASPGDELLVLSQAADGSIANDVYAVRGVLSTVGDSIDRTAVIMTTTAFRELMALPQGAHQITVRVPHDRDLAEAKAAVVGIAAGQDVQTWRELMPLIAQWLDSTRGIIFIVYFIMYIAIAILVLNAMLMAVFERIREFGVMKAIGYGPSTVFWLITAESAVQVTIATVAALLLATPVMAYMQSVGINVGVLAGMNIMGMSLAENWRGIYTVQVVAVPIIVLWVMVLSAATLPALRAARINPVTAMRAH
jgi:putative ABC transport system permease protein